MSLLTIQEKNLTIILLSTALIGSAIGIFRHNWLKNPEILLSPKNLPLYINEMEEESIINKHNILIEEQSQIFNIATIDPNKISKKNSITNSRTIVNDIANNAMNKSESNKKKISHNPSGIININIASKEEFVALPYIGEIKAERIIQLRNEIGTFVSIKDLEKVNGIGPKTLAKIEPFITIE